MNDPLPPRIFLRPIGSPLTLGMSGLAIASLVQSGLDLHWLAAGQSRDVGLILLSVPFVLQIVACVFSYLARDGATGAAIGVLSVSWLAQGLVHVTSPPGSRSGALGLMLLAAGGTLALSGAAVATAKPLPGAVFVLAALRFVLSGISLLGGGAFFEHAGGILGLIVVAMAGYCVLAFELEGLQHRPVLPTFRRGVAAAGAANPAGATDGLAQEPGVRQTT